MALLKPLRKKTAVRQKAGRSFRNAGQLLALTCLLLNTFPANPAEPQFSEPQVKAAFLVNFPKYVEWPVTARLTTNSPITITVLGGGELDVWLAKMIEGKKVEGHPLVLNRIAQEQDISPDCQILFIAASEQKNVPAILASLAGAPVLTIGESDDFLAAGGMINLVHEKNKIALEVNLSAAERAGLKISSKLLTVARIKRDQKP